MLANKKTTTEVFQDERSFEDAAMSGKFDACIVDVDNTNSSIPIFIEKIKQKTILLLPKTFQVPKDLAHFYFLKKPLKQTLFLRQVAKLIDMDRQLPEHLQNQTASSDSVNRHPIWKLSYLSHCRRQFH